MKLLNIYIALLLSLVLLGCNHQDILEDSGEVSIYRKGIIVLKDSSSTRSVPLNIKEYPNMFIGVNGTDTFIKATYSESDGTYIFDASQLNLAESTGWCSVLCTGNGIDYKEYANSSVMEASIYFYNLDVVPSVITSAAKWYYDGSKLTLIAVLSPTHQRLRFVSKAPQTIQYKGPSISNKIVLYNDKIGYSSYIEDYNGGCIPKSVNIDKPGADGQYYSDYIYVRSYACGAKHQIYEKTTDSYYEAPCVGKDYFYVYNPLEPTYCYRKSNEDIMDAEGIAIKYPVRVDNGWEKIKNITRSLSETTQITGNQMTSNDFLTKPLNTIFAPTETGLCMNFKYSFSNSNSHFYFGIGGTDFEGDTYTLIPNGNYSSVVTSTYVYLSGHTYDTYTPVASNYAKIQLESLSYFPLYTHRQRKY